VLSHPFARNKRMDGAPGIDSITQSVAAGSLCLDTDRRPRYLVNINSLRRVAKVWAPAIRQ
jgi:hypothetical protein